MRQWLLGLLVQGTFTVLGQNPTSLPICAQTCLNNSTAEAADCSSNDFKCLCNNAAYINSLSCCLATNCDTTDQQKAIEYNIETCDSVNATAPSFVGCSPLGLSSSVILGSQSTITAAASGSSMSASGTSMSMEMSNSLVSTVTGNVVSQLTNFIGTVRITATFTGNPILTGSCTIPFFATVTDSMGMITEFPEIGCSHDQEGCCPFDSHENAVLTKCPQDYTTTAGACCPSGWQIYFSDLGGQTPCYTMPSYTLVPATTPTLSELTVITEHIFTRKFNLANKTTKPKKNLAGGAIAGIAVGAVTGLFLLVVLGLLVLRERQSRNRNLLATMIRPQHMHLESFSPVVGSVAHELASPGSQSRSPRSVQSGLPTDSTSPTAYSQTAARNASVKSQPPQELPGSTFLHEHHPAFAGNEELQQPATATASPPKSPPQMRQTSPVVSLVGSPKHA